MNDATYFGPYSLPKPMSTQVQPDIPSDSELLMRWIDERDYQARQVFVPRWDRVLFEYAWGFFRDRDAAATAVTETFLKINQFPPGSYKDEGKPVLNWLLALLFNRQRDELKKIIRQRNRDQQRQEGFREKNVIAEADSMDLVTQRIAEESINRLPEELREALHLKEGTRCILSSAGMGLS